MATDRTTDGILHHIRDYLNVREQQAVRINPRIANVIHDIAWAQVESLRHVLQKTKVFGGEKYRVADVLVGEDEPSRRALLSPSDNNSLLPEIVNRGDDAHKRVTDLAIHDMRTLYRAIDPAMENVVQLIQHWILWDLPDAADLFHFDERVRQIESLLEGPISDEVRARYRGALRLRPGDLPTDSQILQAELKRMAGVVQRVLMRRSEEEPYQMIIRRDEQPGSASSQAILAAARHLERLRALEESGAEALGPELIEEYAKALDCTPHEVTVERAADYERRAVIEAKTALRAALDNDRSDSEPYDYKKAQAADLRRRFDAEKERVEARVGAPAQAAVVEAPTVVSPPDPPFMRDPGASAGPPRLPTI